MEKNLKIKKEYFKKKYDLRIQVEGTGGEKFIIFQMIQFIANKNNFIFTLESINYRYENVSYFLLVNNRIKMDKLQKSYGVEGLNNDFHKRSFLSKILLL